MNPKRSINWLYVRLGIVGLATVNGLMFAIETPEYIPGWIPLVPFFFALLSVPFQLTYAKRRERSKFDWSSPEWTRNPFRAPLDGIHMVSFAFMGLGATATLYAAVTHGCVVLPLVPFAFGAGIYSGLRLFCHQNPKLNEYDTP